MRGWSRLLQLLLASAAAVKAIEVKLTPDDFENQKCSGMYSKKAWGGSIDPYISAKFIKPDSDTGKADPMASILIFEWQDRNFIGAPLDADLDDKIKIVCDDDSISRSFCNKTQRGQYILPQDIDTLSKTLMVTKAVHLNDPKAVFYRIQRTGYYCVATAPFPEDVEYEAIVVFGNSYGELPAAQIAKLPFYGGLTIVYAVIAIFWGFLYYMHRQDILPVQNYITAILIFLIVEMLTTWGFYDYQNRHGDNVGTRVLMIVVSVLNAGRNSFSFFLLLIVCMGYGVVKPSLGKTMTYVRWLAVTHFVFGVIYAVASLTVHPEDAGPLVLLVVLPLSATLTAFYIWTLSSLNLTMKDLRERKQHVKEGMYRKLWWCILTSILVIFAFFFFNSFAFAGAGSPDFAPTHWQTRWFVLDGWLNLVYLVDVAFVAYLWRPTANNRRFAMSDEIAQDDDGGFEIASLRSSLDEEAAGGGHPPPYDPAPKSKSALAPVSSPLSSAFAPGASSTPQPPNRDVSPLPAPKPQKPISVRESLDGDTIFAVGEDKWSDEEDSDEDESDEESEAESGAGHERARLTGKK